MCRQGLDEVFDQKVGLHKSKADSVKVNDGHGIGLSLALLRCPAFRNADKVVDVVLAVLLRVSPTANWKGRQTHKTHSLIWIDDLSKPPVDKVAHGVEDQGSSFGLYDLVSGSKDPEEMNAR